MLPVGGGGAPAPLPLAAGPSKPCRGPGQGGGGLQEDHPHCRPAGGQTRAGDDETFEFCFIQYYTVGVAAQQGSGSALIF